MDLIAPGRLKDLAGTSNSPLAKTLLTVAKFSEAKDKPKGRNASSDIDAKLASLRSALGKQRP
ncbi:hypothetical protein NL362_27935, partial [Klebsiella pneumoniae]|nr:hypothetical protein [Klebsiella pneumoniae]